MPEPAARAGDTLRALAGPGAIVAAVLLILHRHVFGGMVDSLAGDPLSYFLPKHCLLGTSLAAGELPLWNPHVMGGLPFLADPQSGWMYLPAMLLYTALPCARALGWFVAMHPIIGGLGIYLFLRAEGGSRPAATVGGLCLALPMAGSSIATGSLPFAGALAWASLTLAAAARYRRAASPGSHLLWATAVAIAWGQIAAAHLSTGLVVGSLALVLYLGAGLVSDVRGGLPRGQALAKVGVLILALPAINAAVLLPRLAYLPRTTLGSGYHELEQAGQAISAVRSSVGTFTHGLRPAWPLVLARAPGYYLGGSVLLLAAPWALRSRRRAALPFVVLGAACFLASIRSIAALLLPLRETFLGTLYLHAPGRFLFGVLLAVAILAGFGLDAWTKEGRPRRAGLLLAGGVAVWVLGPLLLWRDVFQVVASVGVAVAAPVLLLGAGRPRWAWALTGTLAAPVLVAGLWGHSGVLRPDGPFPAGRPPSEAPNLPRTSLATLFRARPPDARVAAYAEPGSIVRHLRSEAGGRYVSVNPELRFTSGYLAQRRGWWGLLASQQSMLFGLEEGQGYDPVQLPRYWTFLRTVDPKPTQYQRSWFLVPSPVAFDLLQIEWVVAAEDPPLSVAAAATGVRQGVWVLYRIQEAPPRASVLTDWSVVATPDEALERVTDPGFTGEEAVVEQDPGLEEGSGAGKGRAAFRWIDTGSATVEVETPAAAIVLVRNSWDPNWSATVDGRPAAVLSANYLVQGIPVPEGRHTIVLTYREPSVGWGLAGSALSVGALWSIGAALLIREGGRRRRMTR